jgi:RTX calcium-binding nonapeptide repeat (4 copies)
MRRAVLLAAAVALLAPATASAHSLVRIGGDVVRYHSADATSLNTLVVRIDGDRIDISDRTVDGGIDPGPCEPGDISDDANAWIVQALCPRAGMASLNLDLGEREDSASVDVPLPVVLLGGPGSDVLRTGASVDQMRGDDGNDDLAAAAGNDVVEGGLGFDTLSGGDGDDVLRDPDGLPDRIECGSGADTVEADTTDVVAADCETVSRVSVAAPPDVATDDTKAPVVRAGGPTLQRLRPGRVHLLATTSERGFLAASGSVDVAGISLPVQANRKRVTVAGGGAKLTIRLTRRHVRMCRKALSRGRRASIRMFAVGTDLAGNSRRAKPIRIRLRR